MDEGDGRRACAPHAWRPGQRCRRAIASAPPSGRAPRHSSRVINNGEAISHSVQFDDCTGAVLAPVSASIAHLKVKGTDSVASLATSSSTTDHDHAHLQVGAVARPDIGPQMHQRADQRRLLGRCCRRIAHPQAQIGLRWASSTGRPKQGGAPVRCHVICMVPHCARHIERLTAACSLVKQFFHDFQAFTGHFYVADW